LCFCTATQHPSYLWRNIIPHLVPFGRCLAPDYVGMGNSGPASDGGYRFVNHQRFLDAWFKALGIDRNVIHVVQDWGPALGFSWAESLHRISSSAAEHRAADDGGVPAPLQDTRPLAHADARLDAGFADCWRARRRCRDRRILCGLAISSPIPKLFIGAEPAGFLIGAQREFCRAWPNQQVVTVAGSHFVQEDAPDAVGEATARFVAKVLAG
jgi:haloalkane dehalogenase